LEDDNMMCQILDCENPAQFCRKLANKLTTETTIFNVLGCLYTACLFLGILNSVFVQPVISDERTVMYRERGAGMYSVMPWYCGLASVELIYLTIQGVLYTCVVCKFPRQNPHKQSQNDL